jgi:hypothetical protein
MNSPNALLIVVDALRADRVGSACEKDLTPHIDQFADDATIFTNAFTTTNATDPAVTSIHTGRYPLSNGLVNHGSRVSDQEKQRIEQVAHLPAVLSNDGYRTRKFGRPLGRWHRQGFDSYPSSMEGTYAKDYTPTKVEKVSRTLSSVSVLLSIEFTHVLGISSQNTITVRNEQFSRRLLQSLLILTRTMMLLMKSWKTLRSLSETQIRFMHSFIS